MGTSHSILRVVPTRKRMEFGFTFNEYTKNKNIAWIDVHFDEAQGFLDDNGDPVSLEEVLNNVDLPDDSPMFVELFQFFGEASLPVFVDAGVDDDNFGALTKEGTRMLLEKVSGSAAPAPRVPSFGSSMPCIIHRNTSELIDGVLSHFPALRAKKKDIFVATIDTNTHDTRAYTGAFMAGKSFKHGTNTLGVLLKMVSDANTKLSDLNTTLRVMIRPDSSVFSNVGLFTRNGNQVLPDPETYCPLGDVGEIIADLYNDRIYKSRSFCSPEIDDNGKRILSGEIPFPSIFINMDFLNSASKRDLFTSNDECVRGIEEALRALEGKLDDESYTGHLASGWSFTAEAVEVGIGRPVSWSRNDDKLTAAATWDDLKKRKDTPFFIGQSFLDGPNRKMVRPSSFENSDVTEYYPCLSKQDKAAFSINRLVTRNKIPSAAAKIFLGGMTLGTSRIQFVNDEGTREFFDRCAAVIQKDRINVINISVAETRANLQLAAPADKVKLNIQLTKLYEELNNSAVPPSFNLFNTAAATNAAATAAVAAVAANNTATAGLPAQNIAGAGAETATPATGVTPPWHKP